jgi:hypothetical protein
MPRRRSTGEGTEYEPQEEAELAEAIEQAFDDYGPGLPENLHVKAQIEWAGEIDANRRGGVRQTNLEDLNLAEVRRLAEKARQEAQQPPLRSYKAKGWRAQLRKLESVRRGEQAKARADLAPSPATLRRWERGQQTPSKANQAKIAAAYNELRNPGRAAAEATRHQMAEALTAAVKERYGTTVRFRNIERWWWQ